MPPHKPIDGDIDLPVIRDKLLELLRIIWAFLCNASIQLWAFISSASVVLWSYITQAFEAVWTWPPFEAFRTEFAAAVSALWTYVFAHPVTAGTIFVLAYIVVPCVYSTLKVSLLRCLGFRQRGILLRDSYAANYQSTSYGGNVPRSSTFARWQSQGAKGGTASSLR